VAGVLPGSCRRRQAEAFASSERARVRTEAVAVRL